MPAALSDVSGRQSRRCAQVLMAAGPWAVAISPDGTFAYVANSRSSSVAVIGTASNTLVSMVLAAANAYGWSLSLAK